MTFAMFKDNQRSFAEVKYWDQEIIALYRYAFPKQFTALETTSGSIPSSATGWQYHDHVIKSLTKIQQNNTDYASLMKKLVELEFKPDAQGNAMFFPRGEGDASRGKSDRRVTVQR